MLFVIVLPKRDVLPFFNLEFCGRKLFGRRRKDEDVGTENNMKTKKRPGRVSPTGMLTKR